MFMLTDWMAARMIQSGWIQKLDAAKVPNLHANIIDSLKSPGWDKKREYSAPWQSGLTGIAYNKSKVDEVKSFDELVTRSDLKGRISLLSEMSDTMGLMLLSEGADPSDFTDDEWQKAHGRAQQGAAMARFAPSPATTTSRTSPQATSWPARRGPAIRSAGTRTSCSCPPKRDS